MSRVIKFRQWYDGKMRYLGHVNTGVGQLGFSDEYWIDLSDEHEQCDIMQFTGLLDKRRAEIYEGDILDGFCSQGRVLLGAVEWQQNKLRFYAPPRRSRSDADLFERMTSFEVVGNVYEHPHLLEESS